MAAFILIVLTAAIFPAAILAPKGYNYILVMLILLLFMATVGMKVSGRPDGILINERKLISLSRFQTALWTLIILSAFLTMASERIRWDYLPTALNITLEKELWMLMGISTASLVGTPLIQSTKTNKNPKPGETDKTAEALNAKATPMTKADVEKNSQGLLFANPDVKDAAFSDMFEGDEIGNTAFVDLSKVQMFLFTIVAALSYAALLFNSIRGEEPWQLSKFPDLSQGFIAILGISHAGFLVNKSVDHTPTT
jgi:hypothetical protein